MNDLAERAIESCIEYDEAKKKIDELTSKIGVCFKACEKRQIENGDAKHWGDAEPCLSMWGDGAYEYDDECDHCPKAYDLIQERKKARKEFGIAKRRVRAVARSKRLQDA